VVTDPQPVNESVDALLDRVAHETVAAAQREAAPPIIRGESEAVGPHRRERGPVREAFHETALMGVMLLSMVVCAGGVGAPFMLVAWRLGGFRGGGQQTGPGVAFAALGLVLALSLGVALVDPFLNWLTRRLHLDE
jgi:hypothetical protein